MGLDTGEGTALAVERLGAALTSVRRIVQSAPVPTVTVPELDSPVPLAKVLACEAVAAIDHDHGPESVTVKRVADWLKLDPSTASRLVGECEDDGLVERRRHSSDRRSTVVMLTDTGRSVISEAGRVRHSFLACLLQDWPEGDIARLAQLLDQFAASWGEHRQELSAGAHCHWSASWNT